MGLQFPDDILTQCWLLAGPTACGKSETALELARLVAETTGASMEIVALDSMSLYRQMDIGTAKPSPSMQQAVPHHLIDVIDPWEDFSTADYVVAALEACREIVARGALPLFVGGTGLYLRSILRGVFDGPPADWDFRRTIEREAREQPPGYLHGRLLELDPAAAASLHPNDERRLVRALEVQHVTGRPLSEQQKQPPLPIERRPAHVDWLAPPREWLYQRIDERVEAMFAAGLVEEVEALLAGPKPLGRTARQGLGYKEVIALLAGRSTREECIRTIQTRTRQFAKRQHTWFRNLEECRAVEMTGSESAAELARAVLGNGA